MGAGGPPQVSVTTGTTQRLALTNERGLAVTVRRSSPRCGRRWRPGAGSAASSAKAARSAPASSLYQIDPATYRASVDNAQATLAKAQATLEVGAAEGRPLQELSAIKAVSQQDADDAEASLLQAPGRRRRRAGGRCRRSASTSPHPHRPRRSAVTGIVYVARRRAGHRQPGRRDGHLQPARSDLRRRHPVQRRAAGAQALARERLRLKRAARPPCAWCSLRTAASIRRPARCSSPR